MARLRDFFSLVKLEHSIFALPFAYTALILACRGIPRMGTWMGISLAMVGGRTAGMALNRIIDRNIDAKNPRTANREIPSGKVSVSQAWFLTVISLAIMVAAAWLMNPWCALVSPAIVGLLVLYPYMKRWSWLTHVILGAVYFCIPPGVWLATAKVISWESIVLGWAMATWVMGFDILYTLQDAHSDAKEGLHSVPVRFGTVVALRISSALHFQTVVGLTGVGWLMNLSVLYWVGIGGVAGLLWYEHRLLTPQNHSRINQAFFTMNGLISFWIFFVVLLSVTL